MKDIKELLNEREVTLTAVAKATGVTRQTLNNIAKGKTKPFSLTVKKVCDYFDVDFRDYI